MTDKMTMFQLEKLLISHIEWNRYYLNMPKECQEVVDGFNNNYGIGYSKDIGWFVLDNGSGLSLIWAQDESLWNKVEHLY